MNGDKSKVMVFEKREVKVMDFITPYMVSVPTVGSCEGLLGGKKMEEMKVYKGIERKNRQQQSYWT